MRYVNVLLPSGAVATGIEASGTEVLLQGGILPWPSQPCHPPSKAPPEFVPPDATAYSCAEKRPAQLATLGRTHHLRGYTFVSVRLNPIRYVGSARELYLSEDLTVTINYTPAASALSAPVSNAEAFQGIVASLVVNPQLAGAPPATTSTAPPQARPLELPAAAVDYLLITSSSLTSAFQPLVEHRKAKGLSAAMITTESIYSSYSGSDKQQKIRNCIKDYYQKQGTKYIALGGDDSIVPDRDCFVSCGGDEEPQMPTDLYYSGLDGTWNSDGDDVYGEAGQDTDVDLAPDVFVGRIPVQTASQASAYVKKLVSFEKAPPSNFPCKMLLCGIKAWNSYSGAARPPKFQDHDPVSDSEIWVRRMYWDKIKPHWKPKVLGLFFDTLTSWDSSTAGDYAASPSNFSTKLNEGWYHVFMLTHGDNNVWGLENHEGYYNTHAAALKNTGKPSIVYTGACNTGHFDNYEVALSEAFLRNPSGGAIAYMGCSRYGWGQPGSTYGGPSMIYGCEFYKQLFEKGHTQLGEAFALHKAACASQSSANGAYRWIQFGMNLQADPAITIVTSTAPLAALKIRDAAGGKGNEVATHTMNTGQSFQVWAAGYDADNNYLGDRQVAWLRLPWEAYSSAKGETRPALGDIDGDGKAELTIGLDSYNANGGWWVVLDDAASNYVRLKFKRIQFSSYNSLNGETWPAVGDLR